MDNVKYITKLISGEDLYYLKDTEARTNLIDKTEKGVAGGVATLDNSGKVPSSQLPESYASVSKLTVGETEYNPIDGNITIPAYPTTLPASDVSAWAKSDTKPSYTKSEIGLDNVTNDAQVKRSEMGVAEGVATLDTAGKIPSSQLPSYVDDVLEYAGKSSFPATGETGKIYVDTSTNLSWRWGGTTYVEISPSLALGETSSTAYAGNKGKALADKLAGIESGAQVHKAPTTAEVKSALGTGSGTSKYLREDGTWLTPPDHTYTVNNGTFTVKGAGTAVSSTSANASGNTAVDIVAGSNVSVTPDATNGKITISSTDTNTWRPVGTGASDAAAGNHTHGISIATDSGTNQITLAHGTKYKLTAGGQSYIFTMPSDNNTTYSAGTGLSLSGTTFSVKTGYTTSGKNYKVLADSNGNLYVNVPWSDNNTTYSGSSTVTLSGTTFSLTKANVTTALGYTPPTTDTNTWRTVQCNGTSIGNNTLNIKAGTNVSLSNSNGTITISSTDTNTWPSKVSQLTNDSGFITASSFTNNNKGTSVSGICVFDGSNGLGYATPSNLASVLGVNSTLNGYVTVSHENRSVDGFNANWVVLTLHWPGFSGVIELLYGLNMTPNDNIGYFYIRRVGCGGNNQYNKVVG